MDEEEKKKKKKPIGKRKKIVQEYCFKIIFVYCSTNSIKLFSLLHLFTVIFLNEILFSAYNYNLQYYFFFFFLVFLTEIEKYEAECSNIINRLKVVSVKMWAAAKKIIQIIFSAFCCFGSVFPMNHCSKKKKFAIAFISKLFIFCFLLFFFSSSSLLYFPVKTPIFYPSSILHEQCFFLLLCRHLKC